MAYSTCSRVAALIPNILNSASDFNNLPANVVPGSAALISFMSSGCALINTRLAGMGYSTPVGSGNAVYDFLADIEANYAAYRAEMARGSPRTAAGERTRADAFRRAFTDGLDMLGTMDLSRSSVAKTEAWYVGGISESEKQSVESNTDRVTPRFSRGLFGNPNAHSTPNSSAS